jgi:ABC-type transport system involved in multi-copper enzyme maturation permease subunit
MTTATIPESDLQVGKPGFGRLVLSEWTKIRSLRSTVWSLILLVVTDAGFTVLFSWLTANQWDKSSAAQKATIALDPTNVILSTGLFLGQLTVCVLGVMVISTEYSTGMIRASLLAVPTRVPMLAAKVAVFVTLVFALGTAVCFGSFFIGQSILHAKAPVSLGDPGVTRAVIGGGLYLAMLGLFSLAIGGIIRHTAGAITAVIGFVLVLQPMAALLPGSLGKHVYAYLPSQAGIKITHAVQAHDDLLSPWQGFGVFALWAIVPLIFAAILLKRRDA